MVISPLERKFPMISQKNMQTQKDESFNGETVPVEGMLEILPDYGVVRQPAQLAEALPKQL